MSPRGAGKRKRAGAAAAEPDANAVTATQAEPYAAEGAAADAMGKGAAAAAGDTATEAAEETEPSIAETVATTTVSLVRNAAEAAMDLATGAARRLEQRPGARERRLRQLAREPLPVLWDEHPDARLAARRDLGLETVPLEKVRGTAVEGQQRAGDFKPIRRLRGTNWEGRWQRIRAAINRLESLPPVDLLRTGDEYWVVDGHNRVAAAHEVGQVAVDANVVDLLLEGAPRPQPIAGAGAYLADDIRDLRAAGEGRLSPTAAAPMTLEDTERLRRTFDFDHEAEAVGE